MIQFFPIATIQVECSRYLSAAMFLSEALRSPPKEVAILNHSYLIMSVTRPAAFPGACTDYWGEQKHLKCVAKTN